jgi:DNA polymerase-1
MTSSLLAEMEKDGYTGEYKAATRGGEYQGPCILPGCNGRGNDRLRVQPSYGIYGYFECRQCGKKGSHVDYLVLNRGYTLKQALAAVGWQPKESRKQSSVLPESAYNGERQTTHEAPCQAWQTAAKAFVMHCEQVLWSEQGREALDYLRARGLKDETIKDARLGYNPARLERSGSKWGCRGKLILWQGIIIPWFVGEDIWRITIRDEKAEDNNRYKQVTGGSNGLYMAPYLDPRLDVPLVLLEGEIDALSVAQECRGAVSAVATGSTEGSRIGKWKVWITIRKLILVAFDADEKGDKAADWWLRRLGEDAHRLRPYWDDANQMLQDGIDLRNGWVLPAIASAQRGGSALAEVLAVDAQLKCHACGVLFPSFEGWDPSKIPTGEIMNYDPIEGNPYCKQCRPDLFEAMPYESVVSHPDPESPLPYLTTPEQVQDLAVSLEGDIYVLDLETTGLNPRKSKIITLALGTVDKVSILDIRAFYAASEAIQEQWKGAMQQLLHRDDITWAGHNLKFDWSFLAVHFGVRLRKVYDTMLVEKLIHNGDTGLKHNLQDASARYDIEVSKEERNWFINLDQRPDEWCALLPSDQLTYIEQDIKVPHQLIDRQRDVVGQLGLQRVVDLEHDALPAIAAMEISGIAVDVARWQGILEAKTLRKEKLEAELKVVLSGVLADQAEGDIAGKLFSVRPKIALNLGSREQIITALAALGVHVEDTKSETLMEVRDRHVVVSQLLEWKELEKFITSFGEKLLGKVERDGRIHADFKQLGARSGRITVVNPALQTIPKPEEDAGGANLRRCFIAPEGTKLLVADLSNIELRILADVSRDPTMLRFFAEGKDLHTETARLLFNLGPDVDTKKHLVHGKRARDIAKTINFGIAYGQSAYGVAGQLDIDEKLAQGFVDAYEATYRGAVGYLNQESRKSVNRKYTVSLSGRRRTFSDEDLSNRGKVGRAAKNHPIQGTGADILKRALALLYDRLPEGAYAVHAVHDELILEVPLALVEISTQHLQDAMTEACRDFLPKVVLPPIDVAVSDYWVKD